MRSSRLAAIGLLTFASHAPLRAQPDATALRFAAMKRLVGTWRDAGRPDSPLRISFALTAGGTVLTERWQRGDREHSLTLYHRDGAAIVATHYCPQGNQPRLASLPPTTDQIVRFAFRDATDLDPAREAYLTTLTFDLSDEARVVRRETYRQGSADDTSELTLVRE